jgi:hypothetical protein
MSSLQGFRVCGHDPLISQQGFRVCGHDTRLRVF